MNRVSSALAKQENPWFPGKKPRLPLARRRHDRGARRHGGKATTMAPTRSSQRACRTPRNDRLGHAGSSHGPTSDDGGQSIAKYRIATGNTFRLDIHTFQRHGI
jgi:hypothetical protein